MMCLSIRRDVGAGERVILVTPEYNAQEFHVGAKAQKHVGVYGAALIHAMPSPVAKVEPLHKRPEVPAREEGTDEKRPNIIEIISGQLESCRVWLSMYCRRW